MSHFPTGGNPAAPRSAERSVPTSKGSAISATALTAKGVSCG